MEIKADHLERRTSRLELRKKIDVMIKSCTITREKVTPPENLREVERRAGSNLISERLNV